MLLQVCDFGLASQSKHMAGAGTPAYMVSSISVLGRVSLPQQPRRPLFARGRVSVLQLQVLMSTTLTLFPL